MHPNGIPSILELGRARRKRPYLCRQIYIRGEVCAPGLLNVRSPNGRTVAELDDIQRSWSEFKKERLCWLQKVLPKPSAYIANQLSSLSLTRNAAAHLQAHSSAVRALECISLRLAHLSVESTRCIIRPLQRASFDAFVCHSLVSLAWLIHTHTQFVWSTLRFAQT